MQQAKEGTKQMIDLPEDEQLHAAIEMSLIEAAAETRKDTVKSTKDAAPIVIVPSMTPMLTSIGAIMRDSQREPSVIMPMPMSRT